MKNGVLPDLGNRLIRSVVQEACGPDGFQGGGGSWALGAVPRLALSDSPVSCLPPLLSWSLC